MSELRPFDALAAPLHSRSLVEASAGTGKTHSITTLYLRFVIESGLSPEQILVVTFTEAATAELRRRIRERMIAAAEGEDADAEGIIAGQADPAIARARISAALEGLDEAAVYTIHGFCHRVLTDCAFESGARFDAELAGDLDELQADVLYDYYASVIAQADEREVLLLRALDFVPSKLARIAREVARSPHLHILPESVETTTAPPDDALREAFAAARALYDRERLAALLATPALNRNTYRLDQLEPLLDKAEHYLRHDMDVVPPASDGLDKLTATRLALGTKIRQKDQVPVHPFFEAMDRLISADRQRRLWGAKKKLALTVGLLDWVRRELPRRKGERGLFSFDDLLLEVHGAIARAGGERLAEAVRRRHPVALVDEFQDTDPVQYEIFHRIWRSGALTLIGDPKQAIYAFRGADVYAYLRARSDVAAARRFTMTTNWRSDPSLVAAVETLFSRVDRPFWIERIEFPAVGARPGAEDRYTAPDGSTAPFEVAFVPRNVSVDLAEATAARISLLIGRARIGDELVSARDVAVLTRTNAQAFGVQQALRRLGIFSVVLGDQSVFASPVAEELSRVLGAVLEPNDSNALRAALMTRLFGLGARELMALDEERPEEWTAWVERFRGFNALLRTRGFIQMFRSLFYDSGAQVRTLELPDGERRFTDLMHLVELLHTAERASHLGPSALFNWLCRQIEDGPRDEGTQIRLESDRPAVRITTVHRSKGLEYPIVLCPYLSDGPRPRRNEPALFHDPAAGERVTLDLGSEAIDRHRAIAAEEEMAENLRLLYVALTRARHHVLVFWGARGKRHATSALGYLLHPPPDLSSLGPHLKKRDDRTLLDELEKLAASSPAIRLSVVDGAEPGRRSAPDGPQGPLDVRPIASPVLRWWRVASFTGLSARGSHGPGEGREHDEAVHEPLAPTSKGRPITLLSFPRGAKAGNFFHELLEHLDFRGSHDREPLVKEKLAAYGYAAALAPQVLEALAEQLATPLARGRQAMRLADIAKCDRADELEFHLPVGEASSTVVPRGTQLELLFAEAREGAPAVRLGRLTSEKLAAVFHDHPSEALDPDYADRVARLGFLPLEGYLKGYIDLVFRWRGRYYVIDYKTNHLGDSLEDYRVDRLAPAMARGHYYLQYHLYVVAVHRWLRRRVKGYNYDKHFGGAHYLFLKGMHPDLGPDNGVFSERPPRERIEALDDLLERPPRWSGEP